MIKKIRNLVQDDRGVTAIEYGLIATLIAIVIITTVALLGERLRDTFGVVANTMNLS